SALAPQALSVSPGNSTATGGPLGAGVHAARPAHARAATVAAASIRAHLTPRAYLRDATPSGGPVGSTSPQRTRPRRRGAELSRRSRRRAPERCRSPPPRAAPR